MAKAKKYPRISSRPGRTGDGGFNSSNGFVAFGTNEEKGDSEVPFKKSQDQAGPVQNINCESNVER